MEKRHTRKGFETIGEAARRLLDTIDERAAKAKADGLERRKGSGKFGRGEMTGFQNDGPIPPLTVDEKTGPEDRAVVTLHRIGMRQAAAGVWSDEEMNLVPRPTFRRIASNDDRPPLARTWPRI